MKYDPLKPGPRYAPGTRARIALIVQKRTMTPKEFWAYVAKYLSVD